jgi:hypothetical protein
MAADEIAVFVFDSFVVKRESSALICVALALVFVAFGLTTETTQRKSEDAALLSNIETYKSSTNGTLSRYVQNSHQQSFDLTDL